MKLPSLPISKPNISIPGRKKRSDTYVVVDVGSSTVRSAAIEVRDGQVVVLGKAEVAQEAGSMWGGEIGNLSNVIASMNEAITRATQQAGVTSDQMVLGLGGALVDGVTTLARVNRPNPATKVNEQELNTLLGQVTTSAVADAESESAEQMAIGREELRLVNSGITAITLDGYTLVSPLGFTGKVVEIGLFNAFVSNATMVALQKMLVDLNVDLAALANEPYVLAQALVNAQAKPQNVNAVIIDVGSGSTSVTLVQAGAVASSVNYAMGGQSVSAAISRARSVGLPEAEQMKQDFSKGSAGEELRHHLQRPVEKEIGLWLQGFKLALAALKSDGPLPEMVYVTGGGSQLPELMHELEKFGWEKSGFGAKPAVERLTVDKFSQIADPSHLLVNEDVVLASLALLVGRQYQEDPKVAEVFQHSLKAYSESK